MIADTARSFGAAELAPGAAARDREHRFPLELFGQMGELGLLAMKASLDDGGAGADNVGYCLAMEAIAESDASVAVVLASSNLASVILSQHATPAQKQRWLAPYAAGKLGPASFALTEPHAGSDASAIATVARRDGTDFVLDGAKMWITSGAQAGIHLVFAKTRADAGTHGISCFVVERGMPGLTAGKPERKMGLRSSGTCALFFDGCRVPRENLIGEVDHGYRIALGALCGGRVGIAAQSIGIAEAAFAEGMRYAAQREAFGQRIIDFQNSQFVLADCRAELDASWLLAVRAATLLDRGTGARRESSIAKLYATEACGRVVDKMLQLHGGYGYSEEYAIERLYRDARITRIYEGTNEIQRIVVARELLRELAAES